MQMFEQESTGLKPEYGQQLQKVFVVFRGLFAHPSKHYLYLIYADIYIYIHPKIWIRRLVSDEEHG